MRPLHLHFLTPAATPAIHRILDAHVASVGSPRLALTERLAQLDPGPLAPDAVSRVARVLQRDFPPAPLGRPRGPAVRLALFRAARRLDTREAAVEAAARELDVSAADIEASLFADLGTQRLVASSDEPPDTAAVIARVNFSLAAGHLCRAVSIALEFQGQARRVVAALRASRLVAQVHGKGLDLRIDLSGPLSLHRPTTVYGHALARFLPALAACDRWRLSATCLIDGELRHLTLSHHDPVFSGALPAARFDSQLEIRFHRDFLKLGSGYTIVREPRPMATPTGWVFPDFAVQRRAGGEPIFIELVGYWTPEYLRQKLIGLAAARITRLLLCVDDSLALGDQTLPEGAALLRYRRRVPASDLIAMLGNRFG
mgnify:FL=1